jgi:hypothetical protein
LAKTAIRILAILLLPLSISIEFGQGSFFQYASLLFTFGSYPIYIDDFYPTPIFDPLVLNLTNIGLAIVVCLPGIYFTRWLNQQPREIAVKKMALTAAVFISLITFPLSMFLPYNPYMPLPVFGGYLLQSVVAWVVAVFVVLPIMSRQGSFIDKDRKAANFSFSDTPEHLIHEGGIRPGRYTILSYILGIIALCIPNSAYSYGMFNPFGDSFFGLITPVWIGTFQSGGGYASLYLYILPSFSIVLTYLMGIFTLIFAYSILQYLQTHLQRMRVFAYAALSVIAPYAIFMVTGGGFMTVIPIPVLLALGLPMIFMLKAISPRQTIWEDKKVKMWYEKDQEITVMGNQPSVRQIMRPEPAATVKVPFSYLIVSKIRGLRSPNAKFAPEPKPTPEVKSASELKPSSEIDPHKADWAESEDLWASGDGE